MFSQRFTRSMAFLAIALTVSACGDSEGAPTAPAADPDVATETLAISPPSAEATVGQMVDFRCSLAKGGAPVECSDWTQANPRVAFMAGSTPDYGYALATGEGTTTITGTGKGASGTKRSGTATIKVYPMTVTLTPREKTLEREQSVTLQVAISDHKGATVEWTRYHKIEWEANPSDGVSIGSSGTHGETAVVIGKKVGQTVVTARLTETADAYGLNYGPGGQATITVVTGAPVSAAITPSSTELSFEETANLSCSVLDSRGDVVSGRQVTWVVETGNAVAVNASTGQVTGLAVGTSTVSCLVNGTPIKASTVVTVRPFVVTVTTIGGVAPNVNVGGTLPLQATLTTFRGAPVSSAGKTIVWSSAAGTTVSQAGVVTGLPPGGGQSRVTATLQGNGGSAGFLDVNVIGTTQPADAVAFCSGFGLPLPGTGSLACGLFGADGTPATNVTWSVVSGPANFTGTILRANTGTIGGEAVVISATGTINGQTVTATVSMTIGAAGTATSVTLSFAGSAPSSVRVGQKFRLSCAASGASGPLSIYSPIYSVSSTFTGPPGSTPPPVAFSIDSFGWLTANATGTATAQCFVNGVRGAFDLTVTP